MVVWFPALWPERCAGVAANAYQAPIAHVDGERQLSDRRHCR
jgi:hypothetical protein